MTDRALPNAAPNAGAKVGVAALGTAAGLSALVSSAACCVLPLALASAGLGAGGLAGIVPYRWPLTIAAVAVIGIGWMLYYRGRRACAATPDCATSAPGRATLIMLSLATIVTLASASWKLFEQPLMRALGG